MSRRVAAALLVVVPFAGCGGGDVKPMPATTDTTGQAPPATTPAKPRRQQPPTDAETRRSLLLPDRVPLRPRGPASTAEVRVIRGWLDALRAGHIRAAARYFSLPARFQNLTTIAIMATPAQAVALNRSLPCGAKFLRAGDAQGFVVYEARLTNRPGGACGSGVGSIVRGAILIRDGKMIEWYRLPDKRPAPGGSSAGQTEA